MKIPGSKWFHQRAVTVATGLPGMEKTSDHPRRGGVHPLAPRQAASQQTEAPRARVDHAAEAINAIHARLMAPPPSEMKRPKPSRLRRIATALLPCVSPGPMDQVATLEKHGGPVAPAQGRPGPGKLHHWQRDRAVILDPAAHALAENIHAALAAHDAALAQHQREGTPASMTRLDAAARALGPWASATHLRELAAAARLQTVAQRTAAYSASEIGRMQTRMDQAAGDLADKLHGGIRERGSVARAAPAADALAALSEDLHHAVDLRHDARRAASVAEQAKSSATAIQQHFDSALHDAQDALLEAMLRRPPGFAHAATPAWTQTLRQLADRLPDRSAKEAIPKAALLETVCRGLAQVTGADAGRAQRALDALLRHSATAWVPLPGHAAESTEETSQTTQDVESVWRLMSKVGRGTEALMLASSPGASLADVAAESLTVRAYWRAGQASRNEADPQVQAWLHGAQQAACAALHPQAGCTASHVQVAALRAVRQGFLSNARGSAYDRANQRLRKTVNEWVDRSGERTRTQRLLPIRGKTPFSKAAVKANMKAAPSFGVVTAAALVDRATRSAATMLLGAVDQGLAASRANGRLPPDDVFITQALARFALKQADPPNSTRKLGWRDARALQKELRAVIKEQLPDMLPGLAWQLRDAKPRLKAAMAREIRHSALIVRLLDDTARRLAGTVIAGTRDGAISTLCGEALQHLDKAQEEGLDMVVTGKLRGKEDLVRLIEPQIMNTQLRTRSSFQSGGSQGLATPNISAALNAVGLPSLFAVRGDNYSRREAFVEIFHPMQGIQLTTGVRRSEVAEGGVSVGPTWKTPGGLLNARATLGGKIGAASSDVDGVVLRIRREPGRLPQMRENLAKVFKDLVHWDDLTDDHGDRYRDPLAALLARNPKLIVADMQASTETRTGELGVAAAATIGTTANAGRPIAVGPQLSLGAKADRASQAYVDGTGEVRVTNECGKVAQQRLVFSAGLTAPVGDPHGLAIDGDGFGRQAGGAGGVQLAGLRLPFAPGVTRDLAQNYEKVSMTHLDFAGTMDSDHDRYYDSPEPLLSEIDANREVWIQRFMEMKPHPARDAQEDEQYRNEANAALDQFRADAQALHATSRFGIYNIHYTMRPDAAPQFETLRALEDLSRESGDEARLTMLKGERDLLLMDPGTWRASTLNIFERGRRAKSNGISFGLRTMRHHGAEVQIQLTEFPGRDRPVEDPAGVPRLPAAGASAEVAGVEEVEMFFDAMDDEAAAPGDTMEPEYFDAESELRHVQESPAR